MSKAVIHYISNWSHCSQILTGFLLLQEKGILDCEIRWNRELQKRVGKLPVVCVEYNGMKIVYDVADGYNITNAMKKLLDSTDLYYKRSYSREKNHQLFTPVQNKKMLPLGMNYSVFCKGNPYSYEWSKPKTFLHCLRGEKLNSYFTPDKFESYPQYKKENIKILFMTRLWEDQPEDVEELNRKRINTVRQLRKEYGNNFIGGIRSSDLALKIAPDLVLSKRFTNKCNYLQYLRDADICIGTLGLHSSTGWKTAEYTAAAKGIVNERLVYENPGSFLEGRNYLAFTDVEECCLLVEQLISDPQRLYAMKKANYEYYQKYLRPDQLIANTLPLTHL